MDNNKLGGIDSMNEQDPILNLSSILFNTTKPTLLDSSTPGSEIITENLSISTKHNLLSSQV